MTDTAPATPSFRQRIAAAINAMEQVNKSETADTGKYQYRYANLNNFLTMTRGILGEHQITLTQPVEMLPDGFAQVHVLLRDQLSDATEDIPGTPFKVMSDPQATGSAITYARRYTLTTVFCLAVGDDDDGAQAHRAAVRPNGRTEAEVLVREIVAGLPDAMSKEDFATAFVEHFGSTLTNLPESRHGDALTWAKARIAGKVAAGPAMTR